jgi:ribosomal-protein-alanine N-acetyltransferase
MVSPTPPTLETERLLLRPAQSADLDAWANQIFGDPDVTRFLPATDRPPRERAERYLEFFHTLWAEHGYGEWIVADKRNGQFMGHCGLAYIRDTGEVEIDYALAQPYWGCGIATEAARASVRYGFERAGLGSLIALVAPDNWGSRRVAEHVGFVAQKQARYFGLDVIYHTLRRADFHGGEALFRVHEASA